MPKYIPILVHKKIEGERIHVPAWLTDITKPAPCICGEPPRPDEPTILGRGENGLKRWFHASCWQMLIDTFEEEDDDEDWEDDEDPL